MLESAYGSQLAEDIEKNIGGKVQKVHDNVMLGLPDYSHILNSVVTYIETKIGEQYEIVDGVTFVQPWKIVKKDIRQYEVCRAISKHALVVYAFYWPELKKSLILRMDQLSQLRPKPGNDEIPWLSNPQLLMVGRGITQLQRLMTKNRKDTYALLGEEFENN
jgi:hypothetical protein